MFVPARPAVANACESHNDTPGSYGPLCQLADDFRPGPRVRSKDDLAEAVRPSDCGKVAWIKLAATGSAPNRERDRAIATTGLLDGPYCGSGRLFAGDGLHSRTALLHCPALRELRLKAAQPMCGRVQALHEGQYRHLQHLLQAARRELGRHSPRQER